MNHAAASRGVPPKARSAARNPKSPYLLPLPEDSLPAPSDAEFFSLDTRTLHDEPESDLFSDDEGDVEDTEEPLHVEGVPKSSLRFDAKRYATPAFARHLLQLCREDLHLPGWCDLPLRMDPTALSIKKVSGALTNAVFFVSCPQQQEALTPPTVLVRVYGPSSESLLSRRLELHVLHTLSSEFQFGPHVLGTFANGRVEEYFESEALNKRLIREPRLSCWIARRLRELHTIDPELMRLPDPNAPGPRPVFTHRNSSNISLLSTSSSSSVYSFGSSASSSSVTSRNRAPSRGRSVESSMSRSGVAEVPASVKRRSSHASLRPPVRHRSTSHDALSVWVNIASWTREAGRVLKLIDRIPRTPGPAENGHNGQLTHPFASPSALRRYIAALDLGHFEEEVKAYRGWTSQWEKQNGRSKRVFAHNDAQYGNILIRSGFENDPLLDTTSAMEEVGLRNPHELLIVVDFEYSALNPRGFDVANHFIEWKADYHSANSHELRGVAPTLCERYRFYRAYIGCDSGQDPLEDAPADNGQEAEDPRVLRLEDEVHVWTPASHAMWTVWALVQARDQVEAKVAKWSLSDEATLDGRLQSTPPTTQPAVRPHLERGRSGEGEAGDVEFDYLLYAKIRLQMFRDSLRDRGLSVPSKQI